MPPPLRIMITSGGGPGVWGLLYALRHLPEREVVLHVSDPAEDATVGTAFADHRCRLPFARDPSYVAELLQYCRNEQVGVLIPVVDGELLRIARATRQFEAVGTRVLLPPEPIVAVCLDKWRTHETLAGTDFLPAHRLVGTVAEMRDAITALGYPRQRVCARPVDQSGGRGFHIIDSQADVFAEHMFAKPGFHRCTAEDFLKIRARGPERFRMIAAEYLEGEELGIDLLADEGRVIECAVRRKAGPLLHGNPTRTRFAELPGERAWVARLSAALRLSGLVSVDAAYGADGSLRLIEVNPRPGAYIGITCARVHLLAWAIDRRLGDREPAPATYRFTDGPHGALRIFADVLVTSDAPRVLPVDAPAMGVAL